MNERPDDIFIQIDFTFIYVKYFVFIFIMILSCGSVEKIVIVTY